MIYKKDTLNSIWLYLYLLVEDFSVTVETNKLETIQGRLIDCTCLYKYTNFVNFWIHIAHINLHSNMKKENSVNMT